MDSWTLHGNVKERERGYREGWSGRRCAATLSQAGKEVVLLNVDLRGQRRIHSARGRSGLERRKDPPLFPLGADPSLPGG